MLGFRSREEFEGLYRALGSYLPVQPGVPQAASSLLPPRGSLKQGQHGCPVTTAIYFPKCPIYRAVTRHPVVLPPAGSVGTHPATASKIIRGATGEPQQKQTRDTARSTEDQFIPSIPSSIKAENNQVSFQQEMRKQ